MSGSIDGAKFGSLSDENFTPLKLPDVGSFMDALESCWKVPSKLPRLTKMCHLAEKCGLVLVTPMNCWRNSTPCWCKASLWEMKIGDFRESSELMETSAWVPGFLQHPFHSKCTDYLNIWFKYGDYDTNYSNQKIIYIINNKKKIKSENHLKSQFDLRKALNRNWFNSTSFKSRK